MPDTNGSQRHREAPHGAALHLVRTAIGPNISEIVDTLHETAIMTNGEQWTIPFGMSCGFEGEIIIRVSAEGDCGAQRKEE